VRIVAKEAPNGGTDLGFLVTSASNMAFLRHFCPGAMERQPSLGQALTQTPCVEGDLFLFCHHSGRDPAAPSFNPVIADSLKRAVSWVETRAGALMGFPPPWALITRPFMGNSESRFEGNVSPGCFLCVFACLPPFQNHEARVCIFFLKRAQQCFVKRPVDPCGGWPGPAGRARPTGFCFTTK